LSAPADETPKIITDIPAEKEPTVRVVIFLPLSKAQLLDRMKYLKNMNKSTIIVAALEGAIRSGAFQRIQK